MRTIVKKIRRILANVKMINDLESKLEQMELFIFGGCPSCDYVGYFSFQGVQQGYKHVPSYNMYGCNGCKTTLNGIRVKEDILQ